MNEPFVTKRFTAPCFGQSASAIEAWLRANVKEGLQVVMRHTQYNTLRYETALVTGIGKGRIYTNKGSFYFSGKSCFHPTGQTRLVMATPETIAAATQFNCPGQASSYRMSI